MTEEQKEVQKSKFKQFITHPKFKTWLAIMGVVVVVSLAVMSLVMVLIPADYGFNIDIANVASIQVGNAQLKNEGRTANYRAQDDTANGAASDSVQVTTIKQILKEINNAPTKTNRFKQVFFGLGGNEYAASSHKPDNVTNASNIRQANISGEIWMRLVFKTPQYCVWRESSTYYFKPISETPAEKNVTANQVTSISFPLGLVENGYRQQTWYLGLGYNNSTPNTSINEKLVTYGNYSGLRDVVSDLTVLDF